MRYPAVLSARINETTWAAIEAIASEHNQTLGEAVRMLLNEGIVQQKRPKKKLGAKQSRGSNKAQVYSKRVS